MELENSSGVSQTPAVEPADTSAELAQSSESQPEESGQAAPEKARPDPVQSRINELTFQRHEADRRANETILALQQQSLQMQEMQRRLEEFDALRQMPDPSQYNSPEDYARAHYAQQQQRQQAEREQFAQRQQYEMQQLNAQREQMQRSAYVGAQREVLIAEGATKYPDFVKAVNNPQLPDITQAHPVVLQTFFGSEKKAEIAYFLAKNPAEAHKLAAMNPVQQIAEIGRIEAKLSRATANTSTPEPLSAVPGQATPRGASFDNLSTADFIKRRNEAERRKMGGR